MADKVKPFGVDGVRKEIRRLIVWPPKSYSRRTEDGFPSEFVYDEYAYKRMVPGCG